MATPFIPTRSDIDNTPSTYRLAGSCDIRTYVACDDTPYHLEQPVTVTAPNPNYNPVLAAKITALRATKEGGWRGFRTMKALIDAHPEATVAELVNLLNQ